MVNNLYLFAYYYWFYQLKESQSDTEISTSSYTVKLEERTLSEGYVNLRYGTDKSWITTFHFNMSNDDMRFSELYTVYVYQSKCQTFNNNSGEISFTLQVDQCFTVKNVNFCFCMFKVFGLTISLFKYYIFTTPLTKVKYKLCTYFVLCFLINRQTKTFDMIFHRRT